MLIKVLVKLIIIFDDIIYSSFENCPKYKHWCFQLESNSNYTAFALKIHYRKQRDRVKSSKNNISICIDTLKIFFLLNSQQKFSDNIQLCWFNKLFWADKQRNSNETTNSLSKNNFILVASIYLIIIIIIIIILINTLVNNI